MSTVAAIQMLAEEIGSLSNNSIDSLQRGSKNDKIWFVMNTTECDTLFETFNHYFDAMFGEDC